MANNTIIKKDTPNQKEFIDELMDKLGRDGAAAVTEPPAAPATEPPTLETEPPAVETEAPSDEGELATTAVPEEEGDEYEEVVELSKEEFDGLLAKIDALGKKVQAQPGATPTSEAIAAAAKPGEDGGVKIPVPDLKKALLNDEEVDLVADEPQVINKAFERMIEAMQPTLEAISKLPGAVEAQVNNLLSVKDVAVTFYKENPDIAENSTVQRLVQMEFDRRASELAGTGQVVNELTLLNEIADGVRKDLGWTKPVATAPGGKKSKAAAQKVTVLGDELDAVVRRRKRAKKKPTLPGGGAGRKPAKPDAKREGEAGKIDELLEELGALR